MKKTLVSAAALALFAGGASAQLVSFTYSDLNGSFNSGTSMYTASADSDSSGDVTRGDGMPGTADFGTGTFPHVSADFDIAMTVSNITASTADGSGTLMIHDANGDSLSMNIDGVFSLNFGSVFFEGTLSNAFFGDESNDGSFDGVTGGSFANPSPLGPLEGSVVELFFDPGSFFAADFSNQDTLVNGLLNPVPAPGTFALLGLGGLAMRRRR